MSNADIYENVLEMIKYQKLTLLSDIIKYEIKKNTHLIIRSKDSNTLRIFILLFYVENEFYKGNNLLKIFKSVSEIKSSDRVSNIKCLLIAPEEFKNQINKIFPRVTDIQSKYTVTNLFAPNHIFQINILKHSLLNYKFKIIRAKDTNHLYEDIDLDKRDNQYVKILPKIYNTDPVSIWIGLEIDDVLYYDGYYRICVEEPSSN